MNGYRFFLSVIPVLVVLTCAVSNICNAADEMAAPAPPTKAAGAIITKERTIEARRGEKQRILMDSRIVDAAVTRPEVADVFISKPQELLVSMNSPGIGKVIVDLENGERIALRFRVHVADAERFAEELRKRIGQIQGINIEVVKGKILVSGRVVYLKEMDAIERAIGDNPSIINLTSLSSRNARIIAREIQRELRESGIYGASVEVRNNRVTLVGSLRSERLVKKAKDIASTYTDNFDSDLKVVPAAAPEEERTK